MLDSLLKPDGKRGEDSKHFSLLYVRFYFRSITKQMRRQSQLSEKHNPSDVQSSNEGPWFQDKHSYSYIFMVFSLLARSRAQYKRIIFQYSTTWSGVVICWKLSTVTVTLIARVFLSSDQHKPWIPHTPQLRPPVLTSLTSNGVVFRSNVWSLNKNNK